MSIGLQGTWTVSVASKSAAWQQRYIIEGSTNGVDDTYSGVTTTPEVIVDGDQWGVTVENNPTGPIDWRPSRMKLANFRVDGAFFKVDLRSDDGGGADEDFNDLVLTASKPLNSSEWIVYGTAKSYSGLCLANPCFPFPWIVIDTPVQLERLLEYDEVRPILTSLYGDRLSELTKRDRFTPLMLPLGGRNREGRSVSGATKIELAAKGRSKKASLHVTDAAAAFRTVSPTYSTPFSTAELQTLGKIKPLFSCNVDPIAQAMLRFVEYDRTSEELSGGPYTGFGDRETLGVSATDEFGNYVYSFTRSISEIVEESLNDVPTGGDPVVSALPDVIVQFADTPEGVAVYETAPYYDIPNVRKIDLCIPARALLPKPCRGGPVLQYLGDIPIVDNPHSDLHADGTVSNRPGTEAGPFVYHAAWSGTVEIHGCFEDLEPAVAHYTLEVRSGSGDWTFVNVPASGLRQQGAGGWVTEGYGPTTTTLNIDGSPQGAPAYRNIEAEPNWSLYAEHLRARVNVGSYLPADPVARAVGEVSFRIRGYDASGDPVPQAEDEVSLYVDDEKATGEIVSLAVSGEAPAGDCALLDLPTDTAGLDITLRATDPDGFLNAWSLSATRGSNHSVPLNGIVADAYEDVAPYRFHGTSELGSSDLDGNVTLTVTPDGGWLGGEDFCAFSFELTVQDRTTNGKTAPGGRRVWDEVVGMRPTPEA